LFLEIQEMTAIASPHNPRLKSLRRLQTKRERARSGLFAAEGEDLVAAAAAVGRAPVAGFRVSGSELGGAEFVDVERVALASVSALGSGTRVIGVYEQLWSPRALGPLCVYLHGVGDPGNVGTILRAAQAFGASCVALGPGCADPHSPKAVRASMGAIFAVNVARVSGPDELPGERVALVAGSPELLRRPQQPPPHGVTLLVGGERHGLPPEAVERCHRVVSIAIASESLNAAMAATVALYEMTREGDTVPAS
jgi:RNA methyltransferase, TrmH family